RAGGEDRGVGTGEGGADVQGPFHRVLGGLVAVDGQGGVDVVGEFAGRPEVEVLAEHDLGAHLAEDRQHRGRLRGRECGGVQQVVGRGEGQVAQQHGTADAVPLAGVVAAFPGEDPVDGGTTAPGVAVVHDVVVDEGESVKHLE